jgi:hypothetical protein
MVLGLRRWDKANCLLDGDSELVDWWSSCSCPRSTDGTCGRWSFWSSDALGGTRTTWSGRRPSLTRARGGLRGAEPAGGGDLRPAMCPAAELLPRVIGTRWCCLLAAGRCCAAAHDWSLPRPRSGPFWAPSGYERASRRCFLGLATEVMESRWWCSVGRLQRGGGGFTGPFWARPGQLGLVCRCCRVRTATVTAVEVVPSRAAVALPSLVLVVLRSLSTRSRVGS